MVYERTTWNAGVAPGISAGNLNNIEIGVEQNNLFQMLLTPGRYKIIEFDVPTAGDITEIIYLTADDSVVASMVYEWDVPTTGQVRSTLTSTYMDLDIGNIVITDFETTSTGDIKETATEAT